MSWIVNLIYKYVEEFIHPISSSQLNLSQLLKGHIRLSDLQLKPQVFDNIIDLPVSLQFQYIGQVSIRLPIWSFFRSPITVEIADALFIFHVKSVNEWDKDQWQLQQKMVKKMLLENHNTECLYRYIGDGALGRIALKLLSTIKIEFRNVEVRVEDFYCNNTQPMAVGASVSEVLIFSPTHNNSRGHSENEDPAYNIDAIHGTLTKEIKIHGLSVYCDTLAFPDDRPAPPNAKLVDLSGKMGECIQVNHITYTHTLSVDSGCHEFSNSMRLPIAYAAATGNLVIGESADNVVSSHGPTESKRVGLSSTQQVNENIGRLYEKNLYSLDARLPYKDILFEHCDVYLYSHLTNEYTEVVGRNTETTALNTYLSALGDIPLDYATSQKDFIDAINYHDVNRIDASVRRETLNSHSVFLQVNPSSLPEFREKLTKIRMSYHDYILNKADVEVHMNIAFAGNNGRVVGNEFDSILDLIDTAESVEPQITASVQMSDLHLRLTPDTLINLLSLTKLLDDYALCNNLIRDSYCSQTISDDDAYLYSRAWLLQLGLREAGDDEKLANYQPVNDYIEQIESSYDADFVLQLRKAAITLAAKSIERYGITSGWWCGAEPDMAGREFLELTGSVTATSTICDRKSDYLPEQHRELHEMMVAGFKHVRIRFSNAFTKVELKLCILVKHFQTSIFLRDGTVIAAIAKDNKITHTCFHYCDGDSLTFEASSIHGISINGLRPLREVVSVESMNFSESEAQRRHFEQAQRIKQIYATGRTASDKSDFDSSCDVENISKQLELLYVSNLLMILGKIKYSTHLVRGKSLTALHICRSSQIRTRDLSHGLMSVNVNIEGLFSLVPHFYDVLNQSASQDFHRLNTILHMFQIPVSSVFNTTPTARSEYDVLIDLPMFASLHVLKHHVCLSIKAIKIQRNGHVTVSGIAAQRSYASGKQAQVDEGRRDTDMSFDSAAALSLFLRVSSRTLAHSSKSQLQYLDEPTIGGLATFTADDLMLPVDFSLKGTSIEVSGIHLQLTEHDFVLGTWLAYELNSVRDIQETLANLLLLNSNNYKRRSFWVERYFYILQREHSAMDLIQLRDEATSSMHGQSVFGSAFSADLQQAFADPYVSSGSAVLEKSSLHAGEVDETVISSQPRIMLDSASRPNTEIERTEYIDNLIDDLFQHIEIRNNTICVRKDSRSWRFTLESFSIDFVAVPSHIIQRVTLNSLKRHGSMQTDVLPQDQEEIEALSDAPILDTIISIHCTCFIVEWNTTLLDRSLCMDTDEPLFQLTLENLRINDETNVTYYNLPSIYAPYKKQNGMPHISYALYPAKPTPGSYIPIARHKLQVTPIQFMLDYDILSNILDFALDIQSSVPENIRKQIFINTLEDEHQHTTGASLVQEFIPIKHSISELLYQRNRFVQSISHMALTADFSLVVDKVLIVVPVEPKRHFDTRFEPSSNTMNAHDRILGLLRNCRNRVAYPLCFIIEYQFTTSINIYRYNDNTQGTDNLSNRVRFEEIHESYRTVEMAVYNLMRTQSLTRWLMPCNISFNASIINATAVFLRPDCRNKLQLPVLSITELKAMGREFTLLLEPFDASVRMNLAIPHERAVYERYYGISRLNSQAIRSLFNIQHYEYPERLTIEITCRHDVIFQLGTKEFTYLYALFTILSALYTRTSEKSTAVSNANRQCTAEMYDTRVFEKQRKKLAARRYEAKSQTHHFEELLMCLGTTERDYIEWILSFGPPPALSIDQIVFNFMSTWEEMNISWSIAHVAMRLDPELVTLELIDLHGNVQISPIYASPTTSEWWSELSQVASVYSVASGLSLSFISQNSEFIEVDNPYHPIPIEANGLAHKLFRISKLFFDYIRNSLTDNLGIMSRAPAYSEEQYRGTTDEIRNIILNSNPWVRLNNYVEVSSLPLLEPFSIDTSGAKKTPWSQLQVCTDVTWINISLDTQFIQRIIDFYRDVVLHEMYTILSRYLIRKENNLCISWEPVSKLAYPDFVYRRCWTYKRLHHVQPSGYKYLKVSEGIGRCYRKPGFDIHCVLVTGFTELRQMLFAAGQETYVNSQASSCKFVVPGALPNEDIVKGTPESIVGSSASSVTPTTESHVRIKFLTTLREPCTLTLGGKVSLSENTRAVVSSRSLNGIDLRIGGPFPSSKLSLPETDTLIQNLVTKALESNSRSDATHVPLTLTCNNEKIVLILKISCKVLSGSLKSLRLCLSTTIALSFWHKNPPDYLELRNATTDESIATETFSWPPVAKQKSSADDDTKRFATASFPIEDIKDPSQSSSASSDLLSLPLRFVTTQNAGIWLYDQQVLTPKQVSFLSYLMIQAYRAPDAASLEKLLQQLNPFVARESAISFAFMFTPDFNCVHLIITISATRIIMNRLPKNIKVSSELQVAHEIRSGEDYGISHDLKSVRFEYHKFTAQAGSLRLGDTEMAMFDSSVSPDELNEIADTKTVSIAVETSSVTPEFNFPGYSYLIGRTRSISICLYTSVWMSNNTVAPIFIKGADTYSLSPRELVALSHDTLSVRIGVKKRKPVNPAIEHPHLNQSKFAFKGIGSWFSKNLILSPKIPLDDTLNSLCYINATDTNNAYSMVIHRQRAKAPFYRTLAYMVLPSIMIFNSLNHVLYIQEHSIANDPEFVTIAPQTWAEFHPQRNRKRIYVCISGLRTAASLVNQRRDTEKKTKSQSRYFTRKNVCEPGYWSAPMEIGTTITRQIRYPVNVEMAHSIAPFSICDIHISLEKGVRHVKVLPTTNSEYKILNLTPYSICYGQTEYPGPFEILLPFSPATVTTADDEPLSESDIDMLSSAYYEYCNHTVPFTFYNYKLPAKLDVWLANTTQLKEIYSRTGSQSIEPGEHPGKNNMVATLQARREGKETGEHTTVGKGERNHEPSLTIRQDSLKKLLSTCNKTRRSYSRVINVKAHCDKVKTERGPSHSSRIDRLLIVPYLMKLYVRIRVEIRFLSGVRWIVFKPYIDHLSRKELELDQASHESELPARLNALWLDCQASPDSLTISDALTTLLNFYLAHESTLKHEMERILPFGQLELIHLFHLKYKEASGGLEFSSLTEDAKQMKLKSRVDDTVEITIRSAETVDKNVNLTAMKSSIRASTRIEGVGIELILYGCGFLYTSLNQLNAAVIVESDTANYSLSVGDLQMDTFVTNNTIIRSIDDETKSEDFPCISIVVTQRLFSEIIDITLFSLNATSFSLSIDYENLITILKFIDTILISITNKKNRQQQIFEAITECIVVFTNHDVLHAGGIQQISLNTVQISDFKLVLNINTEQKTSGYAQHIFKPGAREASTESQHLTKQVHQVLYNDEVVAEGLALLSLLIREGSTMRNIKDLETPLTTNSLGSNHLFTMNSEFCRAVLDNIILQTSLTDAIIYLPVMIYRDLSGPIGNVSNEIIYPYVGKMLKQSANVLGALDLLGNPALVVRNISGGFKESSKLVRTGFATQPQTAILKSLKAIGKGVAIGILVCTSRLSASWGNLCLTVSEFNGELSIRSPYSSAVSTKEWCVCHGDDTDRVDDVESIKTARANIVDEALTLAEGLKMGLYNSTYTCGIAIADLFIKPKRGCQMSLEEEDFMKCTKGLIGGLASLLCGVPAGICRFTSDTSTGALHSILQLRRMRHLRFLRYGASSSPRYEPLLSFWHSLSCIPRNLVNYLALDLTENVIVNARKSIFVIPIDPSPNTPPGIIFVSSTLLMCCTANSILWSVPWQQIQAIELVINDRNEHGVKLCARGYVVCGVYCEDLKSAFVLYVHLVHVITHMKRAYR